MARISGTITAGHLFQNEDHGEHDAIAVDHDVQLDRVTIKE